MSFRLVLLVLAGAVLASLVMALRLGFDGQPLGRGAILDIVLFALPGALAGVTAYLLLSRRR